MDPIRFFYGISAKNGFRLLHTLVYVMTFLLAMATLSYGSSFAPSHQTRATPVAGERTGAGSDYQHVALIYTPGGHCSGSLLRHGYLITAAHCFPRNNSRTINGDDLKGYSILFTKTGLENDANAIKINSSDFLELYFDAGDNDIAYIVYNPLRTWGKIAIPKISAQLSTIGNVPFSLELPGFPGLATGPLQRLVSTNCRYDGFHGTLPFIPGVQDYHGELYNTDCRAWFGSSGSPIYKRLSVNGSTELILMGVVTHTFRVHSDGALRQDAIEFDSFGDHIMGVNFTPLFSALSFVP